MTFIPKDEYVKIIEQLPILCVDVVIQNSNGDYLLVKRANEPLKDQWWVVGGRVIKGETMERAAFRKVNEEVGLEISDVKLIGYFEDIFKENAFNHQTDLHTISIVFFTTVNDNQAVKLDSQSSEWKYSSELPSGFHIKSIPEKEL